jgi:hypothetical protein
MMDTSGGVVCGGAVWGPDEMGRGVVSDLVAGDIHVSLGSDLDWVSIVVSDRDAEYASTV